ncbi:MAG: hypothetical protein AAF721_04415 [Myxococcota bacterium]
MRRRWRSLGDLHSGGLRAVQQVNPEARRSAEDHRVVEECS